MKVLKFSFFGFFNAPFTFMIFLISLISVLTNNLIFFVISTSFLIFMNFVFVLNYSNEIYISNKELIVKNFLKRTERKIKLESIKHIVFNGDIPHRRKYNMIVKTQDSESTFFFYKLDEFQIEKIKSFLPDLA